MLRYRHLLHAWVIFGAPESRGLPEPRVALMPQLFLAGADGALEAAVDSTPLIRRLERQFDGRAVVPPDPVLGYLDALLEDYADEWLTKAMFHYRWAFAPDIAHAAAILPRWSRTELPEAQALAFGEFFAARQIERLRVVGSNPTTAAVIEDGYRRLRTVLDAHLATARFVFGGRPASAAFALFGQLTQLLGIDPTPAAIAVATAPRVVAWVDVVEDLSGLEPQDRDWTRREALSDTVRALLAELGRVYVPFLLANAAALAAGAAEVACEIDGPPWRQQTVPAPGQLPAVAARGARRAGGRRPSVPSTRSSTAPAANACSPPPDPDAHDRIGMRRRAAADHDQNAAVRSITQNMPSAPTT